MYLLITGILIWTLVHLFPRLLPYKRKKLMAKVGVAPYKLAFASLILSSVVMMAQGWQSIIPTTHYVLAHGFRKLSFVILFFSLILFVAAQLKTNLKRYVRHPQLLGLIFWSIAHLLVNGDTRSIILFTGLMFWAILQIIATNWREGAWQLPDKVAIGKDGVVGLIAIIAYVSIIYLHVYITGIALI